MPSEAPGNKITLPVFEILTVPHFGYAVQTTQDRGMILAFNTPAGRRYEFSFDFEGRKSLGREILGPSVLTPDNTPPGLGRRKG